VPAANHIKSDISTKQYQTPYYEHDYIFLKQYYETLEKIPESLPNNYISKQCYNCFMSPRNHFAKYQLGPYFASNPHYCGDKQKKHLSIKDSVKGHYYISFKHFENDLPSKPNTKFEKISMYVFKYTGICKLITFIKSPAKISKKTEHLPFQ